MIYETIRDGINKDLSSFVSIEFESFNKLDEAISVLESNDLLLEENTLKSYFQVIIVKIRELVRKVIDKLKELWERFSKDTWVKFNYAMMKKLREKFNKKEINELMEKNKFAVSVLIIEKNNNLIIGNNENCSYLIKTDYKYDMSPESSNAAMENAQKGKEAFDNMNSEIDKYKVSKIVRKFNNYTAIDAVLSNTYEIMIKDNAYLEGVKSHVKGLQNNLNKIDNMNISDGSNKDKINNLKNCYLFNIEAIQYQMKILLVVMSYISKVHKYNLGAFTLALEKLKAGKEVENPSTDAFAKDSNVAFT